MSATLCLSISTEQPQGLHHYHCPPGELYPGENKATRAGHKSLGTFVTSGNCTSFIFRPFSICQLPDPAGCQLNRSTFWVSLTVPNQCCRKQSCTIQKCYTTLEPLFIVCLFVCVFIYLWCISIDVTIGIAQLHTYNIVIKKVCWYTLWEQITFVIICTEHSKENINNNLIWWRPLCNSVLVLWY